MALLVACVTACNDQTATTEDTSTTSSESPTTAPTTGELPPSGTTDSTGGITTTTSMTGTDSTTSSDTSTTTTATGDTTTGEDAVCITPTDSDTGADPAQWTRSHGVASKYIPPGEVVVAPDGSITVSLTFEGEIDLGDGLVATNGDRYYFLVHYSSAGEFAWSTHIATAPAEGRLGSKIEQRVMAVDCAGNIIVGGSFTGKLDLQGQTLTAVPGTEQQVDVVFATEDIFLAKFGPDGVRHWAHRFGDDRQQRIHDLEIQADGTIVVVGASNGTVDLGGAPIISDEYVGLLAAFDPGGLLVWQRSYSSTSDVAVLGLSIGTDDRMSVYGHAGGDTDFGGGPIMYTDDPTFIAQFDPDGAHRWSTRFFDKQHSPDRVGNDAAGGVVFSGLLGLNRFVARYDNTGQLAWSRDLVPTTKMDYLASSALVVDNEVVIGGALRGSFDFGGGTLITPPDQTRPFLARYDLAGVHLDSATYDTTWARFIGADRGPDGELALLGTFVGTISLGDGLVKSIGKEDLFIYRAKF